MAYILTLLVIYGSNVSIVTQEYKNQTACEAALTEAAGVSSPFKIKSGLNLVGNCTAK